MRPADREASRLRALAAEVRELATKVACPPDNDALTAMARRMAAQARDLEDTLAMERYRRDNPGPS